MSKNNLDWGLNNDKPLNPTNVEPIKEFKEVLGHVAHCHVVNVRKTPEFAESNIIGKLSVGCAVTLIEPDNEKTEFYHVRTSDKLEGYICKKYVDFVGFGGTK